MNLLGAYKSNLSAFHYQQLLQLIETAVSEGEYGGGRLFDQTAAQAIIQQGEDFSNLPTLSAGQRAIADGLNYPVSLLNARYAAISQETSDFLTRMGNYLSVLLKDSQLVDFLIAYANLGAWADSLPQLSEALRFSWDYAISSGPSASTLPLFNPVLNIVQPPDTGDVTQVQYRLDPVVNGSGLVAGLAGQTDVTSYPPTALVWSYQTKGQKEELYGADWASLSLLEPQPQLSFGAPIANRILPKQVNVGEEWSDSFTFTGTSNAGNLPVYVRVLFVPRLKVTGFPDGLTLGSVPISQFQIITDNLLVYDEVQTYDQGVDFNLDDSGNLSVISSGLLFDSRPFSVVFTELFPAYQCSINEGVWSPLVMLDPARPYPDGVVPNQPILIQNRQFPVTDELQNFLGIYLNLNISRPIRTEYLLLIHSSGGSNYGDNATLEIQFDRPFKLNGLRLNPFSTYPVYLRSITADGLSNVTGVQLFDGKLLLDQVQTVRFPAQSISKLFLTLWQENYTIEQFLVDPADKLKRDAMARLQSVLPFSVQRIEASIPQQFTGAQYEFGLKDLAGEYWNSSTTIARPAITIAGPYTVPGHPEIVRVDFEAYQPNTGDVTAYVMWKEYASDGTVSALTSSAVLTSGSSFVYSKITSGAVDHVDFYIKFLLANEFAIIQRYNLQVSNV